MRVRLFAPIAGVLLAATALLAQQQQPKPKSQKEVDALQKVQAAAQAGNPDAELQAINDVLVNFADTEYKTMLLGMALQASAAKGDYAQTMGWGERVLQNNPDDIQARVLMAEDIAQHTRENDLDKEQNLKKADDYANKALELLKSANNPPAGFPPEKWPDIKKQWTGQAHDALGLTAELRKKFPEAINHFKDAVDADTNPVSQAHLAKAYVDNKQYDEAIAAADKVLAMNEVPPVVKQYAQQQKDAATKLKAGPK
jgi:tetratricopeptide (TPR) repeat protein